MPQENTDKDTERREDEQGEHGEKQDIFSKIETLTKTIKSDLENDNISGAIEHVVELGDLIKKIAPQFATLLGSFSGTYGSAAQPFADEFVKIIAEIWSYIYLKRSEVFETCKENYRKSIQAEAEGLAIRKKALTDQGFSSNEVMQIILAKMAKESDADVFSLLSQLPVDVKINEQVRINRKKKTDQTK